MTGIAFVLVYWATSSLSMDIQQTREDLRRHTELSANAMSVMTTTSATETAQMQALTTLMRQICLNTSTTNEQRRECVR